MSKSSYIEYRRLWGDVIELFKIIHKEYDIGVNPVLEFNNRGITRGNKYNLLNKNFHYDIRKYSFTAGVVDIWHSLPDYIVDVDSINTFQSRFPQVEDLVSNYFFSAHDLSETRSQTRSQTNFRRRPTLRPGLRQV